MIIVTGYRNTPHVYSHQERNTNIGIFGEGTYILDVGSNMAATVISANEVRIADGMLVAEGCTAEIARGTTESMTIENGSQGMKRTDLIVARYAKDSGTGVESMTLAVVKGTPAASSPATPAYNLGLIADGDSPVDFPLYQVNLDGISIDSVDCLVDVIGIKSLIESANTSIATLQSDLAAHTIYKSVAVGPQTCAADTGTINVASYDVSSEIPAGYTLKACWGLDSGDYQFYFKMADTVDDTHVKFFIQKRSGTGGTIYPWVKIVCEKS